MVLDIANGHFYASNHGHRIKHIVARAVKKWVDRQTVQKGFDTPDEMVLDLLRREQAREAREQVDALLLKAIDSGESTPMTAGDWERIRVNGRKRLLARRKM